MQMEALALSLRQSRNVCTEFAFINLTVATYAKQNGKNHN